MKIYLAGCGQIGSRLGEQLIEQNEVVGLKRQYADFPFPVLPIDLANQQAMNNLPLDADIIVFTVTPSSYEESGYRQVYETILGNVIDWAESHEVPPLLLLVSSTGVYGQQNGEWVDENSETQPVRASSQWIIFGEEMLRKRLEQTLTVRFSGIYGENRTRLIKSATSGKAIQKTPPIWTNRIHEDDCIGVLNFLIEIYQLEKPLENVYLASDDTPVSQYDVCAFLCEQLDEKAPPIKTVNLTKQCNKRCNNNNLKFLGYQFKYTNYRTGYLNVLNV